MRRWPGPARPCGNRSARLQGNHVGATDRAVTLKFGETVAHCAIREVRRVQQDLDDVTCSRKEALHDSTY